jgi:hypothetical protein
VDPVDIIPRALNLTKRGGGGGCKGQERWLSTGCVGGWGTPHPRTRRRRTRCCNSTTPGAWPAPPLPPTPPWPRTCGPGTVLLRQEQAAIWVEVAGLAPEGTGGVVEDTRRAEVRARVVDFARRCARLY